jgi:glycine cleavage system H protein
MADYKVPNDLKYSKDHEWVRVEGELVVIGITDYAVKALKDIVYVELPQVDDSIEAGEEFGAVESVKAVSDLFAPISGEVVEVNSALEDAPETTNSDPYGSGWLVKVRPSSLDDDLSSLLDAAAYSRHCAAQE